MGKLLSQVIPLALGAAVSPLVFLLQLAVLTGPRRLVRGAAVAVGAAIPLLAVTALMLVVGSAVRLPHASHATTATIDIVLGVLLCLLGVHAIVRPPKPLEKHPDTPSRGLGRSFAAGVAAMASNVTTWALYIPAMKIIAQSGVGVADQAVAVVIVLVITMIPALVPLALTAVAPKASGRVLNALGTWMGTHRGTTQMVLGFGFGAFLLIRGFTGF